MFMKNILKLSAGHLLLSALLLCSLSTAAFAADAAAEIKSSMPEAAPSSVAGKADSVKKDKAGKKKRRMRKKGKKGIKKERSKRLERRGDADGMMRPGKDARPFMAPGKDGKDRMPRLRNHRDGGRRAMFFGKRDKSAVKREKVPSRINRAGSKAKSEAMEHRGDKKAEKEVVANIKDILDLYQALAEKVLEVIESSNPATLIGTVDFQEYTQFRDTDKLYMTCDGKNNSWQINEKANEDFATQLLPGQAGGNGTKWIDLI